MTSTVTVLFILLLVTLPTSLRRKPCAVATDSVTADSAWGAGAAAAAGLAAGLGSAFGAGAAAAGAFASAGFAAAFAADGFAVIGSFFFEAMVTPSPRPR